MVYTCERCNQQFKLEKHYQNHLQRVNPCKNKNIIKRLQFRLMDLLDNLKS